MKRKCWRFMLSLLLVFSFLSGGMAAHAVHTGSEGTAASDAFASITLNGKAIDLEKCPEQYIALNYTGDEIVLDWDLQPGWSVSESYYRYEHDSDNDPMEKGETIEYWGSDGMEVTLRTRAEDGRWFDYCLLFERGKPSLGDMLIWTDLKDLGMNIKNIPFRAKVFSLKSSNTKVLKVKQGDEYWQCSLTPKKPGKCKVTLVLNVNGEKKTFKANVTVKKSVDALKSLKVGGKKVDLKSYRVSYKQYFDEKSTTVSFKPAKGWKVKKCQQYIPAYNKRSKFKSGDKVFFSLDGGGNYIYIDLINGKKETFRYTLYLCRLPDGG